MLSIRITFINLFFATCVFAEPIIIKSGIVRDYNQHHGDDFYDLASKKGITNFEADLGFNKDDEKKYVGAQDIGKYGTELDNQKQYLDEKNIANENFHKLGGSGIENFDNKEFEKKGHHKSGFHNTYHKDESGSKSSYYDDSNGEGGQYLHNNRQGTFGDSDLNKYRGSYLDGNRHSKYDTKQGEYNNEGLYEKGFGNRRNYNQQKFYNDHALQGNSNIGNQYGDAGRYVEERYHKPYDIYERPYYPQSQYYESSRFEPRKTITIYEDPKVYDRNFGYSRHEQYPDYYHNDDSIRLDVRKPPRHSIQNRYQNNRYYYDDDDYY